MNFDASYSLLNDTEGDEKVDLEGENLEGEDDDGDLDEDDPFEVSTTNPWEYDDRDDF